MIAAMLSFSTHMQPWARGMASDFTFPWRAARILLDGQNPYVVIQPVGPPPLDDRFRYPLPAAVVALPFAPLRPPLAGALFVGLGVACFAFALTRDGYGRLPLAVSAPVFWATQNVQWTPLLTAAALLPALSWLWVVKPNIGAALWCYRPSRRTLAWQLGGGLMLAAVSFVLVPTWFGDWLGTVRGGALGRQYVPPVLVPGGGLALLALLRWRRPEARLVAAMACVPQNYFLYDQLPLALATRTWRGAVTFTLLSYAALAWWLHYGKAPGLASVPAGSAALAPVVVVLFYLPALAMVLRRPNEGPTSPWLEQAIRRWRVPPWLAGTPHPSRPPPR
jgi:hypothetical protein